MLNYLVVDLLILQLLIDICVKTDIDSLECRGFESSVVVSNTCFRRTVHVVNLVMKPRLPGRFVQPTQLPLLS